MAEKTLKKKIRTKWDLVGYVNNLFREIDKIYATYDIGKLDLLPSYKYITEDKLVKIMNLWEDTDNNIEDEEKFHSFKAFTVIAVWRTGKISVKAVRKIYFWKERNYYL